MSSGVCGGHSRHWFTRHGSPGERTDRCVRCGSPRKQEPVSPAIPVNLAAAADLPGYRVGSDGSMWKDQGNGKFRKLKIFVERGIARVCVVKPNGKTAKVSVANLVLRSFGVPQPPGHRALRFPDDDPLNNSISNLRWAPISISLAGTKSRRPTGEEHANCKLTDENVLEIREMAATGDYYYRDIAERYGIGKSTVQRIIKGESRRTASGPIDPPDTIRVPIHMQKGYINRSKLTEDDVRRVRYLHATGEFSVREIAELYRVTVGTIYHVLSGRSWGHVS
jgi:hypothetical protein